MTRMLLALLLLMPMVAYGEDLAPDGEDGPTDVYTTGLTTACSSAACEDEVDNDPDVGEDNNIVCTENQNATIKFTFPTPSGNPDTGAGAQGYHFIATKTDDDGSCTEGGGNNPPLTATLYCNGTTTATNLFTNTSIGGTAQELTGTFTFPGACASDGSDFEILFTLGRSGGSPTTRRWAAVDAVEWEAAVAAAPSGQGVFFLGALWEKVRQLWT